MWPLGNHRTDVEVRGDFAATAITIELAKECFIAKAPGIEILGRRRKRRARRIALIKLVEDRWRAQPLLEAFLSLRRADRHPRPVLPIEKSTVVTSERIGVGGHQRVKRIRWTFGCADGMAANET